MKLNRLINGLLWQRSRALLKWRGPLATLVLFGLIASGFALVRASAGERVAWQWPESLSRIFGSRTARTPGAVTPVAVPAGTLYTWNPPLPGTDSKYITSINWTPTRLTPNPADVLVVDGAMTPTTTITDIPTETIGRFRFINGTAATLTASAANTLTIAGEGSAVLDFDVAGSSQVKLSGSNTLTVSLATGATGNIDNLLSFGGTGNKLIAADASAITFPSATNCTVLAGYTGYPFGTGSPGDGADGSVIFNTNSIYTHSSGNSPFGDASHNVVVFNSGSLARFYTATGFEASGRTYANLEIGNASTEVDATDGGSGTFQFDNLTVNNTASQDSSLTFTGAGAGSILIFGNIRSTGTGIGAAATIANVSLTSGSGGIQISNGAGITFDNSGNSRSILLGSDATVASGTNLSLGRIIQNNFLNPNSVLTVDGSITPNVGAPGYIVGNEQRIFTGPGPLDFTFDVGGPAAYSPLDAKNTTGAGSLTVEAKEPGLSSISGANKLQRYWTLTGSGITTDLTFHYRGGAPAAGDVSGNEANYAVFKFDGSLSQPPNQSVNTVNHTATVTGVNSFSSWTLAEVSAVPTTDVTLYGDGNLVIGDVNGDDTNDTLTISRNGANVRIADPNHTLSCGTGATTINSNTCEVPFASITGNIQFITMGGNDVLTVDLAGGDCIPDGGLSYDGGAQTTGDKLSITGGSQGTVTYNYTNAHDGTIEMLNFGTVTYTGLEPITNTGTATDVFFNLPPGGNVATLSGLGGGNSRLASAGTFEQTDFANPTGSVTINGGADNDSISVGALDANYPNLTISGNQGADTVGFTGNTTFAAGASLDVNLQDDDPTPGIDNVFVNGQLIVSGAGTIDVRASEDVTVNSGGKLQVTDGELTVEANQQDPSTATDHSGVDVNGGTIQSIGTGNISITGTGGEGSFDTMYGVIVWSGGKILSTGTGTITVKGTGGARTGGAPTGPPNAAALYGVFVYLSGSEISSASGAITIIGTGGATNDLGSYGVAVEGGKIQQSGAGALVINGTGGTCTGGNAGFVTSLGVEVAKDNAPTPAGGIVTSTGTGVNAGNISITGVAGNGGNGGAQGVRVDAPGIVTTVDGSITFDGTGGACGNASLGTSIRGAVTAFGAGAINITGTGADSTGAVPTHGVNVRSGGVVSASNGDITITGTGGNGTDNAGFDLASVGVGTVQTTGTGNIIINADRIRITTGVSATIDAGANAVSIRPRTPATFIDLGSATDTTANLELSDAELDRITCGTLNIGDNNSESITVTADITRAFSTNVALTAGCDIVISGGRVDTLGGTLLLDSGPSPDAVKPTHAGTDVTASTLSFGSDLSIVINGLIVDTDYTQLNVAGDINLTGVDLVLTGSHTPAVGETFTIVNNAGSNPITGTFNGLAEGASIPNFLLPGATATISYVGDSGNDVVITVTAAAGSADLSVTKSAPATVSESSDFTYTITVSNSASATATATGVSVTDTLPAGVTFVSVSPTPECSESAGTVTCTGLPDIPAGDSDTVEIVVTAGPAPATVQNTASASASNDPSSPHASNTTTTAIITCITELLVNSTGDGSDASPGDSVCETASGNGVCTLRAAIEEANALNDVCGYLTVKFNIPDNDPGHVYYKDDGVPNQVTNDLAHIGVTTLPVANDSSLSDIDPDYPHSWWRIQPVAGLTSINVALDIDGYCQSGAIKNKKHLNEGDDAILRIEIEGSQTAFGTHGLSFTEASGDYSIITGLVVNHFNRAHDLFVDDEGGHIFSGNFLGVDVSGTLGDGTDGTGIYLNSGFDTEIGGDCPADRNVISGHGGEGGAGIWINTSFTTVEGNYIGTDRNGAVKIPNTYGVIITDGQQNIIGCEVPDGDNVISGNATAGISIGGSFANLVEGNFIGTDKTGQLAVPNKTGIQLLNSQLNFIGFGFGNVISGNTDDGVVLKDTSSFNIVQSNLIGVTFTGNLPLGNGGNGVEVYTGSTDNLIGEFPPGEETRTARLEARAQSFSKENSARAVKQSTARPAAKVQGRKAHGGKARAGARKQSLRGKSPRLSFGELFNQRLAKVRLGAAKKQAFVNKRSSAGKGESAANITPELCGCPSGSNTIANNTEDGIKVSSDGDLYNWISQNSIYSNGGLGINLVKHDPTEPPSTVTPNDSGDGDLGPNELQNFPVILSASDATGIVHFSFDTCDEGPYIIEFFANAAGCDPSGNGEGQTYLGYMEVSGSGTYDSDPLSLSPGDVITATATDYNGNTSEFSACFALTPAVIANVSVALDGATTVAENGATNLVYRFSRDDTSAPLTVNFAATGTATANNDYVILTGATVGFNGSTGTVTFGTGVDHVDVTVDPAVDANFESSETVIITATSGSSYNVVNPTSATGTITDDNCPASFTVTDAIDTHDFVPGDGVCGDSLQRCTLRAAIEEANALVNCGTIDINFDFSVETIIVLPLGQLSVQHNVNINGPTNYFLSIDGNGQFRAFQIDSNNIVSISNLTITDCVTSGDGGGVLNNGTLTLKRVTVEDNSAVNGGGIANLTNNSLTLINTTISGNTSTGNGGGLYNANGIATLTNVTIAYNTANSDGAGSESGGGVFVTSGDVTIHNTIVADNLKGLSPVTSPDDIQGLSVNAGSSYNVIGIGSGGLINGGNNNQVGVATALLKPLQQNGGSTRTHALVYNSPAVDSGDDCVVTGCSGNSPVVNIDQRGKERPSDGDNNGSSVVDIGAYERQVTEDREVFQGFDSTVDVVDAIITFPCAEPPCIGARVNRDSAKRDSAVSAKHASGIAPPGPSPTASLTLIDPAPLNSLMRPPNTAIGSSFSPPLPAFEVTTTAAYTPPATVCFYLPSITNPTFFAGLKVLHREAGPNTVYGDSDDVMVDRTRTTNPTDFANKLVCAEVDSFSAFAIAQTVVINPTAEDATVSGQILDSQGTPVEGAAVRMSGTQNRLTITDSEGRYHFDDVETNGFYVVTPSRANFTFSPAQRSFSQLGANTEATFTGAAGSGRLNPLDVTEYFVRQQYLDFLGREPDPAGFNFWVNNIESCGTDIACREAKRLDTSAAFFLSIESQQTGYLIYRFYQAAFGETPNTPVPLRLSEYTTDAARISKGVVVLQNGWQRTLENNTRDFAEDFVKRSRFVAEYPVTMTPVEFVDKLFANGQIPVSDADHALAIGEFGPAVDTSDVSARARVLRRIAENSVLARRHFNKAFVLIEYFGYLRRDPNSGQDRDFSGFNFWLDKLDRFDGNFRDAEMVKAFLTSIEYRARIQR